MLAFFHVDPSLLTKIAEINEGAERISRTKEIKEVTDGVKLFNGPLAKMVRWPKRVERLDGGRQKNEEEFLLFTDQGEGRYRFPYEETSYLTCRRFWDAYAPIKELCLSKGISEDEFNQITPHLFPTCYGVLTILRRYGQDGQPYLLVGLRSKQLAGRHVGTISFPGGLVRPRERLIEAACRQLREECQMELGRITPGFAMGLHPNAASITFMLLADDYASSEVGESFEWKGGKALWAPEDAVLKALDGDTVAMVETFNRAELDVAEGTPIAPDAAKPAKLLLTSIYPSF